MTNPKWSISINSNKRIIAVTAGMLAALAAAFALSICLGSVNIPLQEVFAALAGGGSGKSAVIITGLRLPRAVSAVILGGGLSVSGYLLQTFFRNPLAGPYVLGISSGAKLAVAAVLVFLTGRGIFISSPGLILAAFAGSMLVMGLVLALSYQVSGMSVLVVCGVMVGYICSALTEFFITFADDSNIVNLHSWSMGSFSGISGKDTLVCCLCTVPAVCISIFIAKDMAAFLMGEDYARSVGVNIRGMKAGIILLSSFLSAVTTAFAGPVSFVGIAVPYLMKVLLRSSKPLLILPESFLGGALFCLICDLIARTLFAPTELSISTVTAVFGAPVVIFMLLKRSPGAGR